MGNEVVLVQCNRKVRKEKRLFAAETRDLWLLVAAASTRLNSSRASRRLGARMPLLPTQSIAPVGARASVIRPGRQMHFHIHWGFSLAHLDQADELSRRVE